MRCVPPAALTRHGFMVAGRSLHASPSPDARQNSDQRKRSPVRATLSAGGKKEHKMSLRTGCIQAVMQISAVIFHLDQDLARDRWRWSWMVHGRHGAHKDAEACTVQAPEFRVVLSPPPHCLVIGPLDCRRSGKRSCQLVSAFNTWCRCLIPDRGFVYTRGGAVYPDRPVKLLHTFERLKCWIFPRLSVR
jgi:hypothetical protein